MTPEEFHLSMEKDEALRQAMEAINALSYALHRAEGTMRQRTKYIAEAQIKASRTMANIIKVLEKP